MLSDVVNFIARHDGINNKTILSDYVSKEFSCVKDRSVYYTQDFAIRFCKANSATFSNTVLSLSALQKYDDIPMIICVCAPSKNYLFLANTSFLSKISHSSQELRINNIKGSFNGSDIIKNIDGISNSPENFEVLFSIHQNYTFKENPERLVEATNNIAPTGVRFAANSDSELSNIATSPERAIAFCTSLDYIDLSMDLSSRVKQYKNEIMVAACIENVNLRGRIIEYLVAGEDVEMRDKVIEYLYNQSEFPRLVTHDGLGDYVKHYPLFHTETDIKTKIMVLASAPKGYNLDKMLKFLSEPNTVFMIFLVGIDYDKKSIMARLVSMFHNNLIDNTIIQNHWAGRNSRGVSQFNGEAIKHIILNESNYIDIDKSKAFLQKLIDR